MDSYEKRNVGKKRCQKITSDRADTQRREGTANKVVEFRQGEIEISNITPKKILNGGGGRRGQALVIGRQQNKWSSQTPGNWS